jgi:hypothetical protein
VGIPQTIHSDNAKELMQGEWKEICNEFMINTTYTEPHSPWQNRAEGQIRELKRHVQRKMKSQNVPKRLWNYCVKWSCDVRNKTASNLFALEGRTPYEAIYGHTPDISSLCEFDFYEPVWYFDPHTFPKDNRLLGRWLGEAHQVGQAMCYWILTNTGRVIARSTVQAISEADINTEQVTSELKALDNAIETKLSESSEDLDGLDLPDYLQFVDEGLEDEDIQTPHYEQVEPEAAMPEADDLDHDAYDKYIAAEVILPKGDTFLQVTQPVGYVKLCRAHNVIKSMAEWTARDCYVSLLVASLPFSSIKLLRNCPNFLNTDFLTISKSLKVG